ncbi:MAG: 2-hydroxyacyl-CoA dehydratase family protein [Dehalococcoidia bacterium]
MQAVEELTRQMKTRGAELRELKKEGKKIVGYFPGGYFPEELVLAADAVPVALNRGGDHEPVEVAGAYMSRWIYTFARANIGYRILGTEPVYNIIDEYVVPVTDNHVRIVADTWDSFTEMTTFRYGIPHTKHDWSADYVVTGFNMLKDRLEEITGNKITDEKLRETIDLCNRERELLKEISLMRRADRPPITTRDFVTLNHASLLLDKKTVIEKLEEVAASLRGTEGPELQGPRLMLMGTTLAYGDHRILDFINAAGGTVVIEEFGEGIRHYWETVKPEGDLMKALADRYFTRRVPPAWFRPGTERKEFAVRLANDFKVNGVVWYQLLPRETDDFESYWFPKVLKEGAGVPMLKLVSDYDSVERGQFSTKLETFVDSIITS